MWTQTPINWGTPGNWIPQFPSSPNKGLYIDAPLITLRINNATKFIATNWKGIDVWSNGNLLATSNPFNCDVTGNSKTGWKGISLDTVWKGGVTTCYSNHDQLYSDPRNNTVTTLRKDPTGILYDFPWVPSVYKVAAEDIPANNPNKIQAGDLLGFVHVETSIITANDGPYTIGIAYSKASDNGEKWVYCGDIIKTSRNLKTSAKNPDNITGIPYVVYKDAAGTKWFYTYYCDYPNTDWCCGQDDVTSPNKRGCVARGNFANVLNKAAQIYKERTATPQNNNTSVEPFFKYVTLTNNKYDSNGLTKGWDVSNATTMYHCGTEIITVRPFPDFKWIDFHSDAAYCKPLNKYMLTVSNGLGDLEGALMLYFSDNGIDWKDPQIVDQSVDNVNHYFIEKPHSFFAAQNPNDPAVSDDCHTVGSQFYIYYVYTYHTRVSSTDNRASGTITYQELYRKLITINPAVLPIIKRMQY